MIPCGWAAPKSDDELLQLFGDDLTSAGIQDNYQRGLYMQQGMEQLKEFLAAVRPGAPKEILHTEEWFDAEIAGTKVAGRIDRMDRSTMAASPSSTTKPARLGPRKMRMRAYSFLFTRWPRNRSGDIA